MNLQMLKMALISYVTNSAKAIWSAVAHPLTIIGSKKCNLKDYKIYGGNTEVTSIPITVRGKNLLDVNKWYSAYVNDEGGMTYTNADFSNINQVKLLEGEFKGNTRYTISFDYEITNADSNGINIALAKPDGTALKTAYDLGAITGDKSGRLSVTNNANTTIGFIKFSYSSRTRTCNVKLTDIQIEEGATSTEYEPFIEPQTIDISLDNPLGAGEVIQKSVDGLPNLPQFKGTTIYEVQTDTPPSGIEVCYYG